MSDLPPDHPWLLSYDDLRMIGIRYCREHLRRMELEGTFPKRVRLSPARIAWVEAEIAAWLEVRMTQRGDKPVEHL